MCPTLFCQYKIVNISVSFNFQLNIDKQLVGMDLLTYCWTLVYIWSVGGEVRYVT
jgi:hypothetical protein